MTLEDSYPGASKAVIFHDCYSFEQVWNYSRTMGYPPNIVLAMLKHKADEIIHKGCERLACIRAEMDHPDFLRFVAAKLGAM